MTEAIKVPEYESHSHSSVVSGLTAVQPRLEIGRPDDRYEQEADAVADKVMMMPASPILLPSMTGNHDAALRMTPAPADQEIQMKSEEDEEQIQLKPGVQRQISSGAGEDDGKRKGIPIHTKGLGIRIQRQAGNSNPPAMHVRGDAIRKGPNSGVAVQNGRLHWKLIFKGDMLSTSSSGTGIIINQGRDVIFTAKFVPSSASNCPRITFVQSVLATTGGVLDTGHLLYTDDAQGRSMDVSHGDTEPYYGAGGRTQGRTAGLTGATGQQIGGGTNRAEATHGDAPYIHRVPRGKIAERRFEAAVICIETGQTYGSITWGYRKHSDGTIVLLGAQNSDVNTTGASTTLENVRQAYYRGAFQHSIHSFARGSARLTRSHRRELNTIPTTNLLRVILVGANDNSGGREDRAQLSVERARSVRNYLVRVRGINASLIRIEGHGVAARYPNPPGTQVPQNRRVDIRYERGIEQGSIQAPGPDNATTASPRELRRIRRQNPWFTAAEAVRLIVRLDNAARVSMPEWVELLTMLGALTRWRAGDSTVPDIMQTHRSAILRIRRKVAGSNIPRTPPRFRPRPLRRPDFVNRINERNRDL